MPLPTEPIEKKIENKGDIPIEKLGDKKYRIKFTPDYFFIEKIGNATLIIFRESRIELKGYPPKIYFNKLRISTTRKIDRWNDKYDTFYQKTDKKNNLNIRCRLSVFDYALIFHFIDTRYNIKLCTLIVDEQGRRVKFKYQDSTVLTLWEEKK